MLLGQKGRYLLSVSEAGVFRFDRRTRRSSTVELAPGSIAFEGSNGRFLVVRYGVEEVVAEVHDIDESELVTASGRYTEQGWTFEGDNPEWMFVDRYLLVSDGTEVLQIADGEEPVPIETDEPLAGVSEIPNSRLAIGVVSGGLIVFDPATGRVGENLKFAADAVASAARFRTGENEVWIDNADTLIAIEARDWQVLDAAGYENGQRILCWQFVDHDTVMVATCEGSAFLLDAKSMLPHSRAQFNRTPVDVGIVDGDAFSVDAAGRFERTSFRSL